MTGLIAYDAVKDFLTTSFGGTYPIIDWEQIEVGLQQGTAPFLALDGGAGDTVLRSIGTPTQNCTEDGGTMILHVFVPSTGGLSPARVISAQIKNALLFQYLDAPEGESMRVTTVSPPSAGVVHDGLWHSMLLTIRYEHKYSVSTE